MKTWKFLRLPSLYWLPDTLLAVLITTLRLPIERDWSVPEIEAPVAVWIAFTLLFALSAIFRPNLRAGSCWAGLITGIAYLGALEAYGRHLELPLPVAYMIVQIFIPRLPVSLRRDAIVGVPAVITATSKISAVTARPLTKNDLWRQSFYTQEKFERNWTLRLPRRSFPPVTVILVALNIALFLLAWRNVPPETLYRSQLSLNDFPLAMTRASLTTPAESWRLVSATFFHWSVGHLVSNLLFLFWLGRVLEPLLGSARFAFYYIAGGLAGSAMSALGLPPLVLSAGASGAVYALIGVYVAYLVVHYRVLDVDGKERWAVLFFLLVYFMYTTIATLPYSNVDHPAHMGGLVAGVALLLLGGPYCSAVPDPQDAGRLFVRKRNLLTRLLP